MTVKFNRLLQEKLDNLSSRIVKINGYKTNYFYFNLFSLFPILVS